MSVDSDIVGIQKFLKSQHRLPEPIDLSREEVIEVAVALLRIQLCLCAGPAKEAGSMQISDWILDAIQDR